MSMHRITTVAVSAALLLTGAALAWAADEPAATKAKTQEQEQTRQQAIESVKKRLKENPRDDDLRRAEGCLERSEECQDMHDLDQAMESVRHNMEKHLEDQGLHHAMEQLERHHQRLEKEHMECERYMHRDDSGRPEKPERHDTPEGMHR
jgi:C-terminal processing protease CtpA/Prc